MCRRKIKIKVLQLFIVNNVLANQTYLFQRSRRYWNYSQMKLLMIKTVVDVVFQALGVENENDIYNLRYFFVGENDTKNIVDVDECWNAEYWEKMTSVIDSSKQHVWDALSEGFEKYLSVLTERAALIQETDALEQQNSELRMLIHQYINSK
ncbi:Hypothetical predicted protein, partial [Paramuricea clavata]